ncbi:MAG: ATP cone domain-containing protein, partial [Treponema sp.]|nr:ATP cone domain-containing protein [Treponema sp.]
FKMQRGIERALEKRPAPRALVESLINEIEDEAAVRAGSSGEIPSGDIGDLILQRLRGLDKVAYVRFASVYRHFETPGEFLEEIKSLESDFGPQ